MNDKKSNLKKDYYALNLGYTMAAGMAILAFLGHWLDGKFGGGNRFTLTGMLLGFVVGMYEAWKVAQRMNKEAEREKKE